MPFTGVFSSQTGFPALGPLLAKVSESVSFLIIFFVIAIIF